MYIIIWAWFSPLRTMISASLTLRLNLGNPAYRIYYRTAVNEDMVNLLNRAQCSYIVAM